MRTGNKTKIFLSYSSKDRAFVEDLAKKLLGEGFSVWYDGWEIHIGDSIIHKINEGISSSDFLLIVLSRNSVNSKWVREELNAATIENINSRGIIILPVLLEECQIPPLLSDKRYANFSKDPSSAYRELVKAISHRIKERRKTEYLFDEIPEFQTISTIEEIRELETNDPTIVKRLEKFVDNLKEKCDEYGRETCNTCLQVSHGLCIQRMIATFSGGNLRTRGPFQYGDLSFQTKIDGQTETVVCSARAYRGHGHRFTPAHDGGLISEVLHLANTTAVDVIAIVSGALLHPLLKEYIRQIIESRGKKFIFIEREELIRLAAAYLNI